MKRRDFLALASAMALMPRNGRATEPGLKLGQPKPFEASDIRARAAELASRPYTERELIPESWRNLTYDQYRKIWFDSRNALWRDTHAPQRVDLFPPGLYFPQGVEINGVDSGMVRPILFDMGVFDTTDKFPAVEIDETLGYSGLRLRSELEEPGIYQEYAVFQGASYFRGIGAGETYGLSARGLALKTADP
ncbi:MAG: glucan biosynthesis protein, partial [Pseudomonadota bacterium]